MAKSRLQSRNDIFLFLVDLQCYKLLADFLQKSSPRHRYIIIYYSLQVWPTEKEQAWHTASFGCHCKCISKENNLNFSQNESFIKKLVNLNLECWAGLGIRSSVFWANRLFFSKNEQIMSFEHFAFTKAYNNNSYQCFGWLSGHVSP